MSDAPRPHNSRFVTALFLVGFLAVLLLLVRLLAVYLAAIVLAGVLVSLFQPVLGLFYGPLILTLFLTAAEIYKRDYRDGLKALRSPWASSEEH